MNEATKTKVVVLSGGIDSSTLLTKLTREHDDVRAIYMDIGYLPRYAEMNAAKMVCHKLRVPIEIVPLPGIFSMITGFVPTEFLGMGELDKSQPTPISKPAGEGGEDYVSGFTVILSVATHFCQVANFPEAYVAVTAEQVTYNPGLQGFLDGWTQLHCDLNRNRPFALRYPFATVAKPDIIKLALELGVELKHTWSCYNRGPQHCGLCHGCLARRLAVRQSGVEDLTKYMQENLQPEQI
jgi:7-cyano-7-deazaguanine synthase